MEGRKNNSATSLAIAVAAMGFGFTLGANYARCKAFLGYYFPHTFVLGRKQKNRRNEEPTADELLDIAEDVILASLRGKPAGSSLIANVDPTGAPRVRAINPMQIHLRGGRGAIIHNDGTVSTGSDDDIIPKAFFLTNRQSRKHSQFRSDPRAELIYLEPMGISSVRLVGTVQEMPHSQAKAMWKARLNGFFPEGPKENGRYTTYKFRFHRIEVVSMRHGLDTSERKDWGPYTLLLEEDGTNRDWVYQKTTPEQHLQWNK